MRIIVIGAGGLGGFFGGLLAAAGHHVTFLARGKTLAHLREGGLKIVGDPYARTLPEVSAYPSTPAGIAEMRAAHPAPIDAVLVGVRADQIESITPLLPALIDPETQVITMQNGVLAPGQIAAAAGPAHTSPGIVRIFSKLDAPGVVRYIGGGARFTFAGFDGTQNPATRALRAALTEVGVDAPEHPDIYVELWNKALFMVPFGTLGGLSGQPLGTLRTRLRAQFTGIAAEVESVARAAGVALAPDVVEKTLAMIDKWDPASTTSMQRDILAGRPSEIDALAGGICETAREHGVDVPLTALVYELLAAREAATRLGARPPAP